MAVLAVASVTMMALMVGFAANSSDAPLRGSVENAAVNLAETEAIIQSGDCQCRTGQCDQRDASRGTWCFVDTEDCNGADGFKAKKTASGKIWATCRTVFGADDCEQSVKGAQSKRFHPCANSGFCIDGKGKYTCHCRQGYSGAKCETQFDACKDYPCSVHATCADLPPPHVNSAAGRKCTCKPGYEGDGQTCRDVNACALSPCQKGFAKCIDSPPPALGGTKGRRCVCLKGYIDPTGTGDACAPINACETAVCDPNAVCEDKPAPADASRSGRTCKCKQGFHGDGETCQNIDACKANTCPSNAACVDLPPPAGAGGTGRKCVCPNGYYYDGTKCAEIDACKNHPCGDNAKCTDFFAPAPDSEKGRECKCDNGYSPDSVTGKCVQFDACTMTHPYPCHRNAKCTDHLPPLKESDAGFTCECKPGFYGDGKYCAPIDACNVPTSIEMRTGHLGPEQKKKASRRRLGAAPIKAAAKAPTSAKKPAPVAAAKPAPVVAKKPAPVVPKPKPAPFIKMFTSTAGMMAAVLKSDASKKGYGSKQLQKVSYLQNAGVFGASTQVAWHIKARFTTPESTQLAWRVGATFSHGGFVVLDNLVKAKSFQPVSWSGDEKKAWSFTVPEERVPAGNHLLELVGVDGQGDKGITVQVQVAGGPWLPLSVETLKNLGSSPCEKHAKCSDLDAPAGFDGFQCLCAAGYEFHHGKRKCVDLDACKTSPCKSPNAVCRDKPPPMGGGVEGRVCTCRTGYHEEVDANHVKRCVQTDACKSSPCHRDAHCRDLPPPHTSATTGRECTCKPGFAGDGEKCAPIDACVKHPCDVHATCKDRPAPALDTVTGRECTCNVGYTGDGDTCAPADACVFAPCDVNAQCTDLAVPAPANKAGRKCACKTGFGGTGEVGGCADVDACKEFGCGLGDPHLKCIDRAAPAPNSVAGRMCVCKDGYALVGGVRCAQIDACKTHPCGSKHATCEDLPPPAAGSPKGRKCTCKPGFVGDGEVCADIDACAKNPCDPKAVCIDKPGPAPGDETGRECVCGSGFSGDGEPTGNGCKQIDACLGHPCDVHARCVDAVAPQNGDGYDCQCNPGYRGDGHTCSAVDACVTTPCNAMATCTDLPPPHGAGKSGRTCKCKAGYVGDGESCANLDGCAAEHCDPNADCVDALPPKKGGTCVCKEGFIGDGHSCRDADDCEVRYDKAIDVTGSEDSCSVICVKSPDTGVGASCAAAESGSYRIDCDQIPPGGVAKCYCKDGGAHLGARVLKDISKCQHGTCKDIGLNAYTCSCEAGWSGADCDHEAIGNNCPAGTCSFGACKDVGNDFVCVCNGGYSGKNCDVPPTHWVPLTSTGLGGGFFVAPKGWKLVRDKSAYKTSKEFPSKLCANLGGTGCLAHPSTGPTVAAGEWGGSRHRDEGVVGDPTMGPKYTIDLYVAEGAGAGTADPVFVRVYGKSGKTRAIRAFPSGADRAAHSRVVAYAKNIGALTNVEYFTGGDDTVVPASLQIRTTVTEGIATSKPKDFAMDGDDKAFDPADQRNSQTYPLYENSALCADFRFSVDCPALDLVKGAAITASSERSPLHAAANARPGKGPFGWAPSAKSDGEWLQFDFGKEAWVDRIEILAGRPDARICAEGLGKYAMQPPVCCDYLSSFKVVAKTSAMAGWFTVGTYKGKCDGAAVVKLETPIHAKLLQIVVQDAAAVHWPSFRARISGRPLFGAAKVQSKSGFSDAKVASSCGCWAQSGMAGFAPGGRCDVAKHPDKYAQVCPAAAQASNSGCWLKVKECEQWGMGFLNGEDLWGEAHTDRDGFTAIGLTGTNEEACLRRALEVYQFCLNRGDSDAMTVKATYRPTGATREYPGRIQIVEATYGTKCRYDVKTAMNNGGSSCNVYCAGKKEGLHKGATCIAAHDLDKDRWISCDAARGSGPKKGVTCYCRNPKSAGKHGVKKGNVNLGLEVGCGGKASCTFDALSLGNRDATSCNEDLDVSYKCTAGRGGILRRAQVAPVEAFPVKATGSCTQAHDTNVPLAGWGSAPSSFRATTPAGCQERCSNDRDCLGVQWFNQAMAQTNCVPVMRRHISRKTQQICKIKGVESCKKGQATNCNTWKLTFAKCQARCFDNPRCIAFSYTNQEWNIAHSAGCVVWDEREAAACDSPKTEKSWSTFMFSRDNIQGCYTDVKGALSNTLSDKAVSWQRCKALASAQGHNSFSVVDSKDGLTGVCMGGSGVADDRKLGSHKCLNACTKANGCTRTDGSNSVVDADGHRVSAGDAGTIYSIAVITTSAAEANTAFTCFSKTSQSVTLDCSSNLKFKDYHNVPTKSS